MAAAVDLAAPEVAEVVAMVEVAVLAEAEVHPGNALPDQEK